MEEKKKSFYDFLLANSELTSKKPEQQIKKHYLAISWLMIFFANISILWLGWNYAVSPMFRLTPISFIQSFLLYSVVKVLTRGFFSPQ
jgi:TRAP-type C4-dicarboxylate transport system permease small subunit